jgi:gamma-glutamyltranspeptidase/glutathione hydrolase
MAPTVVMDRATGQPVMVLGSPGGLLIPHYVAKVLWATLHWRLDPQQALALPNAAVAEDRLLLEPDGFPAATVDALASRGHRPLATPLTSGVQLLQRTPDGHWMGAADPRREGTVDGE